MNSEVMLLVTIFVAFAMVITAEPSDSNSMKKDDQTKTNFKVIKRSDWNAAKPIDKSPINSSVPYVILHHSAIFLASYTRTACQKALRSMQRTHQLVNGWDDIGYNFLIGADGEIYEGRGFGVQGAHAPGKNYRLIGNWSVPTQVMLDKTKELIKYGVEKGHIQRNYRLHGHR